MQRLDARTPTTVAGALAVAASLTSPVWAEAGPKDVLARVYALYAKPGGPGMPVEEPALKGYMVADLAHAWAANGRPDAKGDLPADTVDFDPFIEGQDFKISGVKLGDPVVKDACADATVTFRNFGRPTRVRYALAQTPAGWRIANLSGDGHKSLRDMMKMKPSPCG